ncbi:regulatory protein RecX [Gardnerella vaginalis]|uniref:regulatory protein RecX n=1 Tax=Gardnerella vaginalis TaxID=2702 RepID=UPI0039EE3088
MISVENFLRSRKPVNSSEDNKKSIKQVDASKADDFDNCKESALRILDYAARSSYDLKNRLLAKGYEENTVDTVVNRLEELHLVDDERYIQSFIQSCASRMLGERATRVELQRKGIPISASSILLQEARENGVFEDAAWELGRKVASRTRNLDECVRKRRFFSAGARKGHDLSVIKEIYEELFANDEE